MTHAIERMRVIHIAGTKGKVRTFLRLQHLDLRHVLSYVLSPLVIPLTKRGALFGACRGPLPPSVRVC